MFRRKTLTLLSVIIVLSILIYSFRTKILESIVNDSITSTGFSIKLTNWDFNLFDLQLQIDNLNVSYNNNAFLSVNYILINPDALALFSKKIRVDEIHIDAIRLDVDQVNNLYALGGFQLQTSKDETEQTPSKQDSVVISESNDEPWPIEVTQFLLSNASVVINKQATAIFEINNFSLTKLTRVNNSNSTEYNFEGKLLKQQINTQGYYEGNTNEHYLRLDNFGLSADLHQLSDWLPDELKHIKSLINIELEGEAFKNEDGIKAQLITSDVTVSEFSVTLPSDLNVLIETFNINSDFLNLNMTENSHVQIAGNINAKISNTSLSCKEQQAITIRNFEVEQAEFNNLTQLELMLHKAVINDINAYDVCDEGNNEQNLNAKDKKLLSIPSIEASNLSLTDNKLILDELTLEIERVLAYLDEEGVLHHLGQSLLPLLNQPQESKHANVEGSKEVQQVDVSEGQKIHYEIKKFAIITEPEFAYENLKQGDGFNHTISLKLFELEGLTNLAESQNAELKIIAIIDNNSELNIKADIAPISNHNEVRVTGTLNDLILPNYSNYVEQAAGYVLQEGDLNSNIELQLNGQMLEGEIGLQLKGVKLDAVNEEEGSSTGVPINLMLSQIADSKGIIDIDVPISGDISSPEFGVNGFISLLMTKVLQESAKQFITQTYLPYSNVVNVVYFASKQLFKITVQPLTFDTDQADLSAPQLSKLEQLAKLIIDKDLQVSVCATVNTAYEKSDKENPEIVKTLTERGNTRVGLILNELKTNLSVPKPHFVSCKTKIQYQSSETDLVQFDLH